MKRKKTPTYWQEKIRDCCLWTVFFAAVLRRKKTEVSIISRIRYVEPSEWMKFRNKIGRERESKRKVDPDFLRLSFARFNQEDFLHGELLEKSVCLVKVARETCQHLFDAVAKSE